MMIELERPFAQFSKIIPEPNGPKHASTPQKGVPTQVYLANGGASVSEDVVITPMKATIPLSNPVLVNSPVSRPAALTLPVNGSPDLSSAIGGIKRKRNLNTNLLETPPASMRKRSRLDQEDDELFFSNRNRGKESSRYPSYILNL